MYYVQCAYSCSFEEKGAKAAQKRERNGDKGKGNAKSQLKVNEAAKTIVCTVCKQPFVSESVCNCSRWANMATDEHNPCSSVSVPLPVVLNGLS